MGQGIFGKFFSSDRRQRSFVHNDNSVDPVKSQIVINTISDGIAIIDASGIIQLFNPAAELLTGWKAHNAVALDYRSVFQLRNNAGRSIEPADDPIVQAFRTGHTVSTDKLYIETVSKRRIQILLKATPIIDRGSNNQPVVSGLVIVFRDITRERAEQNAQTDFISTASHEMRTPVATIEGYLGMILNPNICTIDSKARDYANKAHNAIRHLGHLFQDLLDVTKADDNRMYSRPVLIDANIATSEIVANFQQKARDKGLTLNVVMPGNQPGKDKRILPPAIIYVDLDHFNEVISNLLENAVKYTKQGGITVTIRSAGGRTRIEVSDTGVGIPAEDIPHLFQKFYRVDNSETREIGGTGLGLYLIKKLTTSMGGTVGVTSDYGHGSTFWVEFDNLTREQAIQRAREIKQRELRERQNGHPAPSSK